MDRLLDRYQSLGARICVEKIFFASGGFDWTIIVLKAEHNIVKEFIRELA